MKKLLLIILVLVSCTKPVEHKPIVLPYTPILSSGSNWGVVISNYSRVKESPSESSDMLTSLTKGTVVEVLFLSRTLENDEIISWYHTNIEGSKGWIMKDDLKVFELREEAADYSEGIK
jgi:hypothetical protein